LVRAFEKKARRGLRLVGLIACTLVLGFRNLVLVKKKSRATAGVP
jgi:hypothetical protein